VKDYVRDAICAIILSNVATPRCDSATEDKAPIWIVQSALPGCDGMEQVNLLAGVIGNAPDIWNAACSLPNLASYPILGNALRLKEKECGLKIGTARHQVG
jgi:hypothetical protein